MSNLSFSTYAVNRYDPTRTLTLRNRFAREMRGRFRGLLSAINDAIVVNGILGVEGQRSGDRVTYFRTWLEGQERTNIFEVIGSTVWINRYLTLAYQRGITRGRQELRNAGYGAPTLESTGGVLSASNNPFHQDRIGLAYTRTLGELSGIVNAVNQQINRAVSQALIAGTSLREIVQQIALVIKGFAIPRVEVLTRTEIVRTHHTATVQEYSNWAVRGVKIAAEWTTSQDNSVCGECSALEGLTFDLDEIEGMIPLHANCRCVAIPIEMGG